MVLKLLSFWLVVAWANVTPRLGPWCHWLVSNVPELNEAVVRALPALDPEGGEGVLRIDLSAALPEAACRGLHGRLLVFARAIGGYNVALLPTGEPQTMGQHTALSYDEAQAFHGIGFTLVSALNRNGWGERVAVERGQLRVGDSRQPLDIGTSPHPDPSYLTAIVTLVGTGTKGYLRSGDFRAKRAELLVFNGLARQRRYPRQRALVHEGPKEAEDRVVLVYWLVPEGEAPVSP